MAGSSLNSNNNKVVKNHLTKYKTFQKNNNFEIEVSLSHPVKMRYRDLNSLIDSAFRFLVSRQTFNKSRANAITSAGKTMQASTADTRDAASP
jgi:hypothetical protein